VRRPALLRTWSDDALDGQFHRALPAQGLALAARLRSRRRTTRLLCPAVRAGQVAAALPVLREGRRPLVADRGRRLLPARDQARARHAGDHALMVAPSTQESARGPCAPSSGVGGSARVARRMTAPVVIYTDGACKGNPGPGGWGALLQYRGRERELFGGEALTTNNRMELTAVIRALESLKRRVPVEIYTDSQYVKNGIETWIGSWKKNGWKTADRKAVKNADLWLELDQLAHEHDITWHWVRGH